MSMKVSKFVYKKACDDFLALQPEILEQQAKLEGFSKVFTSTHNLKLVKFYLRKKNAKILSIIDVGLYKSHNIIWEIV